MKELTFDVARSVGDLLERRVFLGKAGTLTLGALLAGLGAPQSAGAVGSNVPPPTSYSTLLALCPGGSGSDTHTPGLTNTLQAIHVSDTVTFSPGCLVAQNKTVMRMQDTFDIISACTGSTDVSGSGVLVYTSGQNSNWTVDSWGPNKRLLGQHIGVCSGLVNNGPFNGARVWKFAMRTHNDPAACATSGGIVTTTGTNTLIIAQ